MKIAIVGGAGKMGTWIGRFLKAENICVSLIDTDADKLATAMRELEVEGSGDLRKAGESDAIIISVPITSFESTAKVLSPYLREGQTVIDVTSVKTMPVETMHRHFPRCLVLGAHPVFGPGATGLEGHNIVLTPTTTKEKALAEQAKNFLEERSARVQAMTPEEHDRLMAVVLGLAHYIAIVSGDTMLSLDNLAGMEMVSGVTFRVLMTMIVSVLGEDPSLYASIQTHLPDLPFLEGIFVARASEWAELVKQKDNAELIRRMTTLTQKLARMTPAPGSAYRNMYNIAEGR
jgi:prephenate dehydrogenase